MRSRKLVPNVNVSNLTFKYRNTQALDRVNFTAYAGDFFAIIGPNGSGKSTLCKVLQGILSSPKNADALIAGKPAGTISACRLLAYCGDNDHMPRFVTGEELIHNSARLHSHREHRIRVSKKEIEGTFAQLGMEGRHNEIMETYSHGMLKKTQLAASLLIKPPVIIVDETLNGVDIEAQYKIEVELHRFCQEGGTVLMCSHDFAMQSRNANKFLLLDRGRVVVTAPVVELAKEGLSIEDLVRQYIGIPESRINA